MSLKKKMKYFLIAPVVRLEQAFIHSNLNIFFCQLKIFYTRKYFIYCQIQSKTLSLKVTIPKRVIHEIGGHVYSEKKKPKKKKNPN